MIATGLTTVETPRLLNFLKEYFLKEQVELVIIGMPTNWNDTATHATPLVEQFITAFKKHVPAMPINVVDERFTSKLAARAIAQMGLKKKDRQKKELVDEVAATMMLQEYLQTGNC